MDNRDRWIKHIKKLAKDNADLWVTVRSLRLEVTSLKDEVDHYKREFARQNAKILTMSIQREVEDLPDFSFEATNVVNPPGFNGIKMVDPYNHSIGD